MQDKILEQKPRRNPKTRWRLYKKKVIIAPALGLNETGAVIWQLSDGSKTVKEIADHLQTIYEGDSKDIENSVVSFILSMRERTLISLDNEGGL